MPPRRAGRTSPGGGRRRTPAAARPRAGGRRRAGTRSRPPSRAARASRRGRTAPSGRPTRAAPTPTVMISASMTPARSPCGLRRRTASSTPVISAGYTSEVEPVARSTGTAPRGRSGSDSCRCRRRRGRTAPGRSRTSATATAATGRLKADADEDRDGRRPGDEVDQRPVALERRREQVQRRSGYRRARGTTATARFADRLPTGAGSIMLRGLPESRLGNRGAAAAGCSSKRCDELGQHVDQPARSARRCWRR